MIEIKVTCDSCGVVRWGSCCPDNWQDLTITFREIGSDWSERPNTTTLLFCTDCVSDKPKTKEVVITELKKRKKGFFRGF